MSYSKIRPRGDLKANWESANPILSAREIGVEWETKIGVGDAKIKFGDGVTAWKNLDYAVVNNITKKIITTFATVSDADPALNAGESLDTILGKIKKKFQYLADNKLNKSAKYDGVDSTSTDLYATANAVRKVNVKADKNASDITTLNNNLSRRLLVGDNIASADLLNDNPDERFGTLSMRFSDGTMNQLLLLKKTAAVTILRNNTWTEQYQFATTSMLSDYVPKSDLVVSSADLQSKQNVSDDSNIKFCKYGKIVVAHISIKTTSNLSGYDTLKLGVAPSGFHPLNECRCVVLMQQRLESRILSFTTWGEINLWNWSSDSSITTPSGSTLNGFAVYFVA